MPQSNPPTLPAALGHLPIVTCPGCGRIIGRAGRTNEQISEAHARGEFLTAVGITDYGTDPPTTTYYCWPCWENVPTSPERS